MMLYNVLSSTTETSFFASCEHHSTFGIVFLVFVVLVSRETTEKRSASKNHKKWPKDRVFCCLIRQLFCGKASEKTPKSLLAKISADFTHFVKQWPYSRTNLKQNPHTKKNHRKKIFFSQTFSIFRSVREQFSRPPKKNPTCTVKKLLTSKNFILIFWGYFYSFSESTYRTYGFYKHTKFKTNACLRSLWFQRPIGAFDAFIALSAVQIKASLRAFECFQAIEGNTKCVSGYEFEICTVRRYVRHENMFLSRKPETRRNFWTHTHARTKKTDLKIISLPIFA